MKALQVISTNRVELREVSKPEVNEGEVLVRLSAASLNRRDHWIREGKYPNIIPNTTLGSDGCGEVLEIGQGVPDEWLNKQVVINPNVGWGDNSNVQAATYQVLGMPTNGTLAEFIVVPHHRLAHKPTHLSNEQASALPLGGLTAFRAVFHHGKLQPNQHVLITGAGGGVSQMAFLWAKAHGAIVSVTSGSEKKLSKMLETGAAHAYNYHQEDWAREVSASGESFDLIIDSAGGAQFNSLIKLIKPGGRLVYYGATAGLPSKVDLYRMFWNQITLQGSTMGNDQEFLEMLSFVNQHQLVPMIDSIRPFDQVIKGLDRMKASQQFGKIVVSLT